MPRQTAAGKWQARIVDPVTKKRVSLGTFQTMKEARVKEITELARIEAGEIVGGGRIKFEKFALDFLESRKHDLSPETYRNYLYALNRHILPTFAQRELRNITPASVRAWFLALPDVPSRKGVYSLMSQIMKQALRDGEIVRTPVDIKGAMRDTSKARDFVPLGDVQMLRTMAGETSQMGVLLLLMVGAGIRIGEALALDWEDIDIKAGTVHVHKHLGKRLDIVQGTKHQADGDRTVALPEVVRKALEDFRNTRSTSEHDDPVFLNTKGNRYSYHSFNYDFDKLKNSLGLFDLHAHDLRHTGLTLYAQTGATQGELMARGGHKDVRSSLRYQHSSPERDKANAEKMTL